jgi:hypothetical protein
MPETIDIIEAKNVLSARLLKGETPIFRRMLSVRSAAEAAPGNVHAVGVGRKIVNGKATEQMCVRIYVTQKLAVSVLPKSAVLPEDVDGIPTDIIESPAAFILTGKKTVSKKSVKKSAVTAAALACTEQRK